MGKTIYTRNEFEAKRSEWAASMSLDQELQERAVRLLVEADRHNWIHQTTWLGEPALQLPQDLFALQDIIYRTKPDFLVEVGVAWGGALLFYATVMEALGHGHVIGIDVFMPPDLKERLFSRGSVSSRISLVEGSSLDDETLEAIRATMGESKNAMVHLDSHHTHDHVLQELRHYSPFVGGGNYLVCADTVIANIPVQSHRPRPWGPGNNPMTAVADYLREDPRFEQDDLLCSRLLLSCNPGGYLRALHDPE